MALGIIGGADGPTAILVSSPKVSPWLVAVLALACVAIVTTAVLVVKNKKKK